jgi:hypothetical protein
LIPSPRALDQADHRLPAGTDQVRASAARHAIPAIYEWREFAEARGLMSYGTNLVEVYRLQGVYADRILKGEKPADLPVQLPTKFELVVQPQDCEGARPRDAGSGARPRRRGDRVTDCNRRLAALHSVVAPDCRAGMSTFI